MAKRTRPGIREDNGMEGLPFKLIIVSLIMALSLPIVISNWMVHDRQETISRLQSELDFIEGQMDLIYDGGLGFGNSRVVEVTLRDGTFTEIEYIEIGDGNLTSLMGKSVRWKLKGEEERIDIISWGIPVMSDKGTSFVLRHGLNELYLEIKEKGGVAYVEISHV
ncbi:MAG: hypothetical protein KAI64_05020 [Thermoplasmata archaeon]|nr:hypothetical protein [Thermoplasmata archaeon]